MRPLAALLPLLLLVVSPLQAQNAPRHKATLKHSEPEPPPPSGAIRGIVLCADTHRPARGATVFIEPLAAAGSEEDDPRLNSLSRTATDGTYSVQHVRPGDYIVLALFPGYLSDLQQVQALSELKGAKDTAAKQRERLSIFPSITVDPEKTTTFDITLQRGAAISGRVLYSDGSPAAQVQLQLEHAEPETPARTSADLPNPFGQAALTHQSLVTDDLGHYRITSLKPGTYRIAAIEADSAPIDYSDMSYASYGFTHPTAILVYSADTVHKADATTYDLRAGEEISGADITIALDALHHVRGTLTATDGRPINSARLTLKSDGDDPISFTAAVLQDGTFDFPNIPPGTYKLQAEEAAIQAPDPDQQRGRYVQMKTIHAFEDRSMSLIVKDSDLLDVSLTLKEVPLKQGKKDDGEDDDDKE